MRDLGAPIRHFDGDQGRAADLRKAAVPAEEADRPLFPPRPSGLDPDPMNPKIARG